jgi:hypothetical protein
VRFATAPHENRSPATPVTVTSRDGAKTMKVNQQKPATIAGIWVSLGAFNFTAGQKGVIEVSTEGTTGNVHIDAVNIVNAE